MQLKTALYGALTLAATSHADSTQLVKRQTAPYAVASSNDNTLQLTTQSAPVSGSGNSNGVATWNLTMDDSDGGKRQNITGFGSAVTDGTVQNYLALTSAQQQQLVKDMMTSSGANFQLLRHTIASSDLSPSNYSYDDNGGTPDLNLTNFNLGTSGRNMAAMLKTLRGAQSNLTILGSPWSAPAWMKNAATNTLNMSYVGPFAQYFVKYLNAYSMAGAPVDYITIQNEPMHNTPPTDVDFTMGVSASDSASLILNNVGPALANANLSTQIWALDHNTEYYTYPDTVFQSARKYTNTVAWHCYDTPRWSRLSDFRAKYPTAQQYMTECYTYSGDKWTQINNNTFGPLQNWAQGVISWPMGTAINGSPYLADGCSQCRGLFLTNTTSGTYSLTRDYYMLAQFSKYIQKGAYIHNVTGNAKNADGTGVDSVSAINPDGTLTLVVQNNFTTPLYLTLSTTSGRKYSGQLYPQSLTSWVLPASS